MTTIASASTSRSRACRGSELILACMTRGSDSIGNRLYNAIIEAMIEPEPRSPACWRRWPRLAANVAGRQVGGVSCSAMLAAVIDRPRPTLTPSGRKL